MDVEVEERDEQVEEDIWDQLYDIFNEDRLNEQKVLLLLLLLLLLRGTKTSREVEMLSILTLVVGSWR